MFYTVTVQTTSTSNKTVKPPTNLKVTECPKMYRKSVLHLLKYRFVVNLSRCDIRILDEINRVSGSSSPETHIQIRIRHRSQNYSPHSFNIIRFNVLKSIIIRNIPILFKKFLIVSFLKLMQNDLINEKQKSLFTYKIWYCATDPTCRVVDPNPNTCVWSGPDPY